MTASIEPLEGGRRSRQKIDLYEDAQVEKAARKAAEKLELRADLIELDLNRLADLLEDERERKLSENTPEKPRKQILLTQAERKELSQFGKRKDLLKVLNEKIGASGIVGERVSRLFLFVIALSHRMDKPLHAVVQGSSGSGKSYLIGKVSELVPQEKVRRYTRLSEKSLYNFGEYEICHHLFIIEDYDGMNEEVEYAFRELQSGAVLRSGVSVKREEHGPVKTADRVVRGPIASLVATTKTEIYHDNATRVFFVAVDESEEQTERIIAYKNQHANGKRNKFHEDQNRLFVQQFVSTLKPQEVLNPWIEHIRLPVVGQDLRRLHELFSAFCEQLTLLHQHQRQKDPQGRLITEKQDVQYAVQLMFESIVLKVDELSGSLREFYEKLKEYVKEKGNRDYTFIQREVRHHLGLSKTQVFRYFRELEELEYIRPKGRGSYGATSYKILYWDDNQKLRAEIKTSLENQLAAL